MLNQKEIDELIDTRMRIAEKDKAINLLHQYVYYLSKINPKHKLIKYIEVEIIPICVFECIFGLKIYSISDIEKFYKYNRDICERELRKVFLQSRSGISISKSELNKLWEIFDISIMIMKTHDFESWDIFHSWIKDSYRHLKGAVTELRKNDYTESLKRLQLGIECLVKSYALYIGCV